MDYNKYVELQVGGSDWSYNSKWGDQMEKAITEWFGGSIDNKDAAIIDIGCGEGRGIRALNDMGFTDTTGIDLSKEKLDKGVDCGLNLIYQDMHEIHKMNKKFDYAFSSHALEHVYDLKKALDNIMLVTNKLYYIVPIHEKESFAKAHNPSHTHPIDNEQDFINVIDEMGFGHTYIYQNRMGEELWGIVSKN